MDFYIRAFLVYIISINLVSDLVCCIDKRQARCQGRRISEKNLFALCLAGGALGMYFTMLRIRHKTRHKRFMIGLPLIILFQLAVLLLILTKI